MQYFTLYIPFILSSLLGTSPESSYWVAWLGSWFIIWVSFSGRIKPLPEETSWQEQLLRPLFLPQLIFAGYMALSSIFYFFSLKGYYYFEKIDEVQNFDQITFTAQAQRFYVLGHAAFVHAVIYKMNYEEISYRFSFQNLGSNLLRIAFILFLTTNLLKLFPIFQQFAIKIENLNLVASTLLVVASIYERQLGLFIIGSSIFGLSLYSSFISGWKEAIIVPIIMLGAFLYPMYKKIISISLIPALFLVFYVLPTYMETFRDLNWGRNVDRQIAGTVAFNALRSTSQEEIAKTNWSFLTERLSEIGMFIQYIKQVPSNREFYGLTIFRQGLLALVPRALYPDKPITEALVMERVYENGVAHRSWDVSAKPPLIVDGYLSFGVIGLWLTCFLAGIGSAVASVQAEQLFGGYTWGTCFIYTGLFQIFWRGNCFEFMINAVIWSFILMYLIFYICRSIGILVPQK